MSESALTIGVHEAGLARAQAESVARQLVASSVSYAVHLEIVRTPERGPHALHDDHIAEHRGAIRHLHQRLAAGDVDLVIHRGFDLRGEVPDGLTVAAVPARSNPFDVLLSPFGSTLDEMDAGQRVGVVQLRARAQLLDYRPDLEWRLVHGDVGAWLSSLIDGDIDALVSPGAALEHLNMQGQVCEIFPPELVVPAPGSGMLVCLAREDDARTLGRLRALHDRGAALEYTAECALIESLGGRWESPVGALARLSDTGFLLHAMVASPDGLQLLRQTHACPADDPCAAGAEVAALLLDRGADDLLTLDDRDAERILGALPDAEADWEEEPRD